MNYHLVGKELAEDLKLLSLELKYCSGSSLPYMLLSDRGPENQDARKKIHGGGQNLKDHWLLA